MGPEAWLLAGLALLILACWVRCRRPAPHTKCSAKRSAPSETESTSAGFSDSPKSLSSESKPRAEASASCWPFKELLSPCIGVAERPGRQAAVGWDAEYKYGYSRSELYSTSFDAVEDASSLVQAVVPATKQRETLSKLQHLMRLAEGLPSEGWVRPRDPRVLLRFLLARQLDVSRAFDMLQSVLHWRSQSGASNALASWDKVLHEQFDHYFKCLSFTGTDHDGDPVVVERCARVHYNTFAQCNEEFLKRHVIYQAECAIASVERSRQLHLQRGRSGAFQVTVVLDMQGLDMSFADRRLLHFSKVLGGIEKDNYPELLKKIIVVRTPWFFPTLFQMVRPFLDAGTEKKILVPSELSVLRQHVPSEALPEDLGGSCASSSPPGGPVPDEMIQRTFQ